MPRYLIYFLCVSVSLFGEVTVGLEHLFSWPHNKHVEGKRIGLVTNQTAVTKDLKHAVTVFKEKNSNLVALFSPEHGMFGAKQASQHVDNHLYNGIQVYSLYGDVKAPTEEMLKGIDVLVFDIQDIGSRSYTYISTLFRTMEACSKYKVPVVVLDRPNPINGLVVDGPMLKEELRSTVGYVNVPYCHGMTVGELASFFNQEYKVGCHLHVVPMQGWKRDMTFQDTHLPWIPTSPYVPTANTVYYYPLTGILGELRMANIGIGYTLPFQLVGAPWIEGENFAKILNQQKCPGVVFYPYQWTPFSGSLEGVTCHGVLIVVTDHKIFKPVTTSYVILGIMKSLYPLKFKEGLEKSEDKKEMFCKVNGTKEVLDILLKEKYVTWKLKEVDKKEREEFLVVREKYLKY